MQTVLYPRRAQWKRRCSNLVVAIPFVDICMHIQFCEHNLHPYIQSWHRIPKGASLNEFCNPPLPFSSTKISACVSLVTINELQQVFVAFFVFAFFFTGPGSDCSSSCPRFQPEFCSDSLRKFCPAVDRSSGLYFWFPLSFSGEFREFI